MTWFCHQQLHGYHKTFSRGGAGDAAANGSLKTAGKRFSWLLTHLKEYDIRYGDVFPTGWRVKYQLCLTFCTSACQELDRLLQLGASPGTQTQDTSLGVLYELVC